MKMNNKYWKWKAKIEMKIDITNKDGTYKMENTYWKMQKWTQNMTMWHRN